MPEVSKTCKGCEKVFNGSKRKLYCNTTCRGKAGQKRSRKNRSNGVALQEKSKAWKQAVATTPEKALETSWKRYANGVARKLKGKIKFELSLEDYGLLIFEVCHYCGAPPALKMHTGNRFRSSIDRLDPSKDYVTDNCVTACWTCNKMKGTLSYTDFIAAAHSIAKMGKQRPESVKGQLHMMDRANLYNSTFPKYPNVLFDKEWLIGVWNIGNNYKGSGYHGSYPHSYLKRITSMFPDQENVVHLFSGSLPPGDYTRVDINDSLNTDLVANAEELSNYLPDGSVDIIYADPPYTESDANKYGFPMVNRNRVVKECYKVLKTGGFLCWMDMVLPMYRKDEFKRVGEIAISRSTNHRIRGVFIFQKIGA